MHADERGKVKYAKARELALEKNGDAFNLAILLRGKDFALMNKRVTAAGGYIYMCVYMCVCVYMYIYIYIYVCVC